MSTLSACHLFGWAGVVAFSSNSGHQLLLPPAKCCPIFAVRATQLAEPSNQRTIRKYCEAYPGLKMILAHCARGFNMYHTIEVMNTCHQGGAPHDRGDEHLSPGWSNPL